MAKRTEHARCAINFGQSFALQADLLEHQPSPYGLKLITYCPAANLIWILIYQIANLESDGLSGLAS